ncbi:MAG TPA: spore coat protein U domain-containing protein [Casimicrobiaceae bacterium]|nr:spore coat protein U domain-containing protein [Casimicrobiaceae bacterium]
MSSRNMKYLAAAIVAGMIGSSETAWAAGTHAVSVSASVNQVCQIIDATSTLGFGALDPAAGGAVAAVWSGGSFRCTKGSTFTVTSDDGLWESAAGGASNRMRLTGAVGVGCANAYECIRYTLTKVATGTGTGHGAGNNLSFAVTGATALVDYTNANFGSYTDTVTLTVAP